MSNETLVSKRDSQVLTSNEETDMMQMLETICEKSDRDAESD